MSGVSVEERADGVQEIEAEPTVEDERLEMLFEHVPAASEEPEQANPAELAVPALRVGRVVSMNEDGIEIRFRQKGAPVLAELDEGVDPELLIRAMRSGDGVLVEVDPVEGALIVGVVQRSLPSEVEIKASRVVIDAEEEVLLRSGRSAMRFKKDGEVELLGERISSVSRGLFRIVGRVLRLN